MFENYSQNLIARPADPDIITVTGNNILKESTNVGLYSKSSIKFAIDDAYEIVRISFSVPNKFPLFDGATFNGELFDGEKINDPSNTNRHIIMWQPQTPVPSIEFINGNNEQSDAVSLFKDIRVYYKHKDNSEFTTQLYWGNKNISYDFSKTQQFGILEVNHTKYNFENVINGEFIQFWHNNSIIISLPDIFTINQLEVYFNANNNQTHCFVQGATCNGLPLPLDHDYVSYELPTPSANVTITNGDLTDEKDNNDYLRSQVNKIIVHYNYSAPETQPSIPVTPSPSLLQYDKAANLVFLQVIGDDGTPVENATITYAFSQETTQPEQLTEIYDPTTGIDLKQQQPGQWTLWAAASMDNAIPSLPTIIDTFDISEQDYTPTISYNEVSTDLVCDNWYIITTVLDGSLYAMRKPDTNGNHAIIKIADNETEVKAALNQFDKMGVLEFTVNKNGHLVEKNSKQFLQPRQVSRSLSSTEPQTTVFSINSDGSHSLIVNNQELGTDGKTIGFSLPGNIKLYTTGNNMNTSIDIIVENSYTIPVIYYNLQGIQVQSPVRGIYIKRQGNKTTKIKL
ncbi:MAG: hypothetical protein NC082_06755 [Clostridiales bacterium]|nr:hypothetical protein [Clostridiales bacterium]